MAGAKLFTPEAIVFSAGYSYIGPESLVSGDFIARGGTLNFVHNPDNSEFFITTTDLDSLTADTLRRDSQGILPFTLPSAELTNSAGFVWSGDDLGRGMQEELSGPGVSVNPSLVGHDLSLSFNTDPKTGHLPLNIFDRSKPVQTFTLTYGKCFGIPDSGPADFSVIPTETEAVGDRIWRNIGRLFE